MKYKDLLQKPSLNFKENKRSICFLVASVLIVGFVIGWFFTSAIFSSRYHITDEVEGCSSNLQFIRQNINCEYNSRKKTELARLETELEALTEKNISSGNATRLGVLVRDLRSTHFAGVNETESFYGASLLKLPLIIASYKQAEIQPEILAKNIKYDGGASLNDNQSIEIRDKLVSGTTYTIKELIDRSVIYSDNISAQILYENLPPGYFDLILNAVGIKYKLSDGSDEILVAPRTYANLFRLLYNTSYLTAEYSNEILETLTKVDYRNGAMKHLPPSLKVAHKFAERTVEDPITKKVMLRQLHECGLVYLNNNEDSYSFCIMIEGKDFADLEKIQQDYSLIIYNRMKSASI